MLSKFFKNYLNLVCFKVLSKILLQIYPYRVILQCKMQLHLVSDFVFFMRLHLHLCFLSFRSLLRIPNSFALSEFANFLVFSACHVLAFSHGLMLSASLLSPAQFHKVKFGIRGTLSIKVNY